MNPPQVLEQIDYKNELYYLGCVERRSSSIQVASCVFSAVGNIDMTEIGLGEGQWFAIRGGPRFGVR